MTVAEVAKRTGVSHATISRVINHQRGVSDETAANVRRVMREIGYVPAPNRPGRRQPKETSRMTHILLLVISDKSVGQAIGFQKLMAGVCAELKQQGASLSIEFVSSLDEFRALDLASKSVDGILAHVRTPIDSLGDAFTHLPTVWLMSNPARPLWGDQAMPDGDEIGHIAADYLLGAGRKNLAYLDLHSDHWASRLRSRPFIESATASGVSAVKIALPPAVSDRCGVSHFDLNQSGRLAEAADYLVADLLDHHPEVDGAFFATDRHTALLVPALQRRGVDLGPGGDIEIISCDNERQYLLGLTPSPPTIDIHVETIGRRGASQLLQRIADPGDTQRTRITVMPSLVLSETAGTVSDGETSR